MKKEFKLVFGSRLSLKPNVVDQVTIDETQSRVNELMGVSDMDFVREISKMSPDESVEDVGESILKVAEMMDLDAKDIEKYGCKEPFSESKADVVDQVTIDETVLSVAEMMSVDVEDIRKYGSK